MSWKDTLRRDPGGFYRMRTEQGEVRIFMTESLLAEAEEALGAQIVIFLSTAASYALGLHTYFNHPRVLNAEMELSMNEALTLRAFGLVGGPIENGAAAFLGWLIGGVLPERKGPAPV